MKLCGFNQALNVTGVEVVKRSHLINIRVFLILKGDKKKEKTVDPIFVSGKSFPTKVAILNYLHL